MTGGTSCGPCAVAGEKVKDDWHQMCLCNTGMAEESRVQWWLDKWLDYMAELIGQGQQKSEEVLHIALLIETLGKRDLEKEIADPYVQAILDIIGATRPLVLLLTGSLRAQMANKDELCGLRKAMRTKSVRPLARIANAVASCRFWADQVQELFQVLTTVETHWDKLEQVHQAEERAVTMVDAKRLQELAKLAANISFLNLEVPQKHLKEVSDKGHSIIVESLKSLLDELEAKKPADAPIDAIQNLLAEAGL